MISEDRKQELTRKGYYVEDMGAEYGPEWKGQFRWMNNIAADFQDDDTSFSVEDTWDSADHHEQHTGTQNA
jgi:hypothetical protein